MVCLIITGWLSEGGIIMARRRRSTGIFLARTGVVKPANCIMVAGRKRAAAISAALRTGISL
jgi:hypothetical protein